MASDLRLMDCDLDRLVRGAATASPDGSTFWPTKKGSLKFSDYQLHDNKRIWKLHIFLIFNWSLASLCTRTRHSIGREPMPQLLFTGANSQVNIRAASLIVKMSMIPDKPFSHRYCLAYFTSTVHTWFTGTAENQLSTWFQVMIRSFSCLRIARANSDYLWVLTAWMVFIHPFQRQNFMHLISNPQPHWRTWNLRTFLSAWRRKRRFHELGRAPPCPGSSRISGASNNHRGYAPWQPGE